MKVLNICVNGAYTDGFSYHENLLPRYHGLQGNEVLVLASEYEYNQSGKYRIAEKKVYKDKYNIKVIRLKIVGGQNLSYKFKRFEDFYEHIENFQPDIIFCHLFQFLDFHKVVKYVKKHSNVKLYVDSHADYRNSARTWGSKNILHKIIWRTLAINALPVTERFYGVTPARVEFLKHIYGIPSEKCELLVMGADDELVQKTRTKLFRNKVRGELGICECDKMILVGGKIDYNKPEIITLIRGVGKYCDDSMRLVVFGSIQEEYKDEFFQFVDGEKVKYVGWLQHEDIYAYFSAADIIVFPGLHSVMWEEAVGYGKPCVFRKIEGFNHIDVGGNCDFFDELTEKGMWKKINNIWTSNQIITMKMCAEEKGMKKFSYYEIAKKSILQE